MADVLIYQGVHLSLLQVLDTHQDVAVVRSTAFALGNVLRLSTSRPSQLDELVRACRAHWLRISRSAMSESATRSTDEALAITELTWVLGHCVCLSGDADGLQRRWQLAEGARDGLQWALAQSHEPCVVGCLRLLGQLVCRSAAAVEALVTWDGWVDLCITVAKNTPIMIAEVMWLFSSVTAESFASAVQIVEADEARRLIHSALECEELSDHVAQEVSCDVCRVLLFIPVHMVCSRQDPADLAL
jgi:hypothetical protein